MKKKALILLVLIIAFGAFLRLYKFESTLILDADKAMAFLLADRIINHGHQLLVGPGTSLTDVNILPPTYYYLITGLYYLLRNELSVSLVFAFASIVTIYLTFLLAKLLFDTKTGLTAAYFYALSATMVSYSRNIWEPHLVPFFISLFLIFLYLARAKGKILYVIIATFFFATSFMYISSFLLLPSFVVLTVYIFNTIVKNRIKALFLTIASYLTVFGLFYLPVIHFESSHAYPSLFTVLETIQGSAFSLSNFTTGYINSVSTHFTYLIKSLLLSDLNYTLILFFIPFLIPVFLCLKTALVSNRRFAMLFMILASGLFLTGLYQKKVETHRMASLYPVVFVVLAFAVKWSTSALKDRSLSFLVGLLVLFYTLIYTLQNYQSSTGLLNLRSPSRFETTLLTARYILDSAGTDSFTIYTITPIEKTNYYSAAYVYAIEKITRAPYSGLNKEGNWIYIDLNRKKQWIYLICQNFTVRTVQILCKNEFEKMRNLVQPVKQKLIGSNWIFKYNYSRVN